MYTHFVFILYIWCLSSELILNDDQIWLDDFAFDASGQNGWNLHKTSDDRISDSNPMVIISNQPQYHGPLTSDYYIERFIRCNTHNNARLFVSMLSSYCNTNKKGDQIEFSVFDTSHTNASSAISLFPSYRLNQKNVRLDEDHIPFVRNTTAYYYTNHSSSTTITPICALYEQWYRAKKHKTYELTVVSGNIYQIKLHISLNRDTDSYVMLSHIAILCVNIPTISPTNKPTSSSTASLISNSTFQSTIFSTDASINEHESTLDLHSTATEIRIQSTAINEHEIVQKRSFDILRKLKSLHVFYYISAILLFITCCCVCGIACICISINVKLKHSLSSHQKNSSLPDINVVKMASIKDKDSESSTVSIDFSENSDAASIDFNEGIHERTSVQIETDNSKEDDDAHSEAEFDGYRNNRTDTR